MEVYCDDVAYIQDEIFKARLKAWRGAHLLMPCSDDRSDAQCQAAVLADLREAINGLQGR